jgi:hypothetical protein
MVETIAYEVILLLANQPEMYSASGEGVRWKSVSQSCGRKKGQSRKGFQGKKAELYRGYLIEI